MGRAVVALMLREMTTTYGRSPGGYIWAVLEPIGGIAILSFVFGLIARVPSLGTNFPLFFATGIVAFGTYQVVSSVVGSSIQYSRALLTYPAVTLLDALIARLLLNLLTQFLVATIILVGIIELFDLKPIYDWGAIATGMGMAAAIGIGVGTVNCILFNLVPIWKSVWSIASRPMFILSGVIFIPESVPEQFRSALMLNPVIHATSKMRQGFYATYDAVHVVEIYPFFFGLILTVFGLLFLTRYHKEIVLR